MDIYPRYSYGESHFCILSVLTAYSVTNSVVLSFCTNVTEQLVETLIRLLLEEQSDQGLHGLPIRLCILVSFLNCKIMLYLLYGDKSNIQDVRKCGCILRLV